MTCPRGTTAVEGHAGLCRVESGAYAGVIVNEDGVVDSHLIDVTEDAAHLMSLYNGEEVTSCRPRRSDDPNYTEIPGVTFTREDVARLRDVFGSSASGAHGVVFCSDVSRPGVVGINLQPQAVARNGITRLMSGGWEFWNAYGSSCTSLFSEDAAGRCEALVDTLRLEYREAYDGDAEGLTTLWETVRSWAAASLALLHLVGAFVVFGPALRRYTRWAEARERERDPRDDDDGNPPAAGIGGGGLSSIVPSLSRGRDGASRRVALPDTAEGILAFHGMDRVLPSREGAAILMSSADVPVRTSGSLAAPLVAAPLSVPTPVVAARPVVFARPVLAVP